MLSKRWGVCGNSVSGYPDSVYCRTVKLGWLRSLVLDMSTWQGMYDQIPQETNIAAVITGQSGPLDNDFWSDGWRDRYISYITEFCERFYKKVRLIEFANEWDMWDNADRAEKAAELAIVGTAVCKKYGILGMLGSVAGADWVAQLERAISVVDSADRRLGYSSIHGFCFHPYMSCVKRERGTDSFTVPNADWERLSDKIEHAISVAGGRTCAITEVGIKVGDAGGLGDQSRYVHGVFEDELSQFTPDQVLMATYFCWSDQNGSPGERGDSAFGLVNENGQLRPAYQAFTYQMQQAPVVDLPVAKLLAASQPTPAPEPAPEPTPVPPDEPTEPPTPGSGSLTAADAHGVRWRAIVPNAMYHHDFGFERHFRMEENSWWGSPLTEGENVYEDGRPLRVFANAVVVYNPGNDTIEVLH